MTPEILAWLESVKRRFIPHTGAILEVGSFDVNGSPRSVFADAESYLGIDQAEGPGVDRVTDAHWIRLPEKYDLVLCCEMLEHDSNPLATIETLRWHLKPGGILIVTSPGNGFQEHRYPRDYWRLMPDAYTGLIFAGMDVLEIRELPGPTTAGAAKNLISTS
jgi:SAM-dependent methyltransferase